MARKGRPMTNISNVEQRPLPVENRWIHRLINRPSYRVTILVLVCTLNIVDLLIDWYFYISKKTIKKGLVFGPPSPDILLAMLVFCVISTFTSILEIIQVIRDTCRNNLTSVFAQITNCLTLWLEDFPFLTLNLLIVICRDGEVTYISLAKAIIGIIAALIRFLFIFLNKWLIRHDYQRKDPLSHILNTISTLGVILIFILSISIHTIANLPIDSFGRIHLQNPLQFTRFKFAHQKYFKNVGLFLHSTNDVDKYIYVMNIDTIIEKGQKTFMYSINENENIFCIKNVTQTCFFELNNTNIDFYDKPLNNKLINYSITFQFQEPDSYYLLGDITYDIIRCDLKDLYVPDYKISFLYYRFKRNFNQTIISSVIYDEQNNTYRYFDVENDFEPIEHVWRTGLSRCTSTSSFGPHRSQNISMNDCY